MANFVRFSIETLQGMDFWKNSGYFLGYGFPKKNNRFPTEAIQF